MNKQKNRRRHRGRPRWWPSHRDPYWEVAVRAAQEALQSRLIDKYWDLFQEVYEKYNVREAEITIWRALSDALSPERVAARLKKEKRGRRPARRKAARKA